YGDRDHEEISIDDQLSSLVNDSVRRGGVLLIPSFAIGRTQVVLYYLRKLRDLGVIPDVPVYVDSPMAIDATDLYCRYADDHNLNMDLLTDSERCPLKYQGTHFT